MRVAWWRTAILRIEKYGCLGPGEYDEEYGCLGPGEYDEEYGCLGPGDRREKYGCLGPGECERIRRMRA